MLNPHVYKYNNTIIIDIWALNIIAHVFETSLNLENIIQILIRIN
jgi:hypothetical protein